MNCYKRLGLFFFMLMLFLPFAEAQPLLQDYVKVMQKGEDPIDYIYRLFETSDVVILGERDHREVTQYELITRLMADPRFAGRIGYVYTEVGVTNMTQRANALIKGKFGSRDEYVKARLDYLRDEDYSFCWEKTNRSIFIDSLYSINSRLADGKKITLGLTDVAFDWHKRISPAKYRRWYRKINSGDYRDKAMAENFIRLYQQQEPINGCRKALIITNMPHAINESDECRREGYWIKRKLGSDRVKIVCLNTYVMANGGDSLPLVDSGRWDAAFKLTGERPVGFDIANTVFGQTPFNCWGPDINKTVWQYGKNWQDYADGIIYDKPFNDFVYSIGIKDFIDPAIKDEQQRRLDLLYRAGILPSDDYEAFKVYYNTVRTFRDTDAFNKKKAQMEMEKWLQTAAFTRADNRQVFPSISETRLPGYFPLATASDVATVYTDSSDFKVVGIAADMLAADVKRVTGKAMRHVFQKPNDKSGKSITHGAAVVAGTLGHNPFIDKLVSDGKINISDLKGKWESFTVTTISETKHSSPLLVVVGSDRRGTAFGLTSLSEAIGVSPWYWWADVTPQQKSALYVEPGVFHQKEPSVQYRGFFINDERFGGWARWAESNFETETGKVGPKTYQKVFELLLRLKANYLWPAMHPGTAAFNSNPENARLADDYAIVMGSSHCEQMLRNNEDEWKKVGIYGDFNYITNRPTIIKYWEDRIKTNGRYENTYTLGLRGIHDYPMEGAKTTEERVKLMQEAIDDQREILRRNINKPIEEIPQVLIPYEEVLDAYHHGLKVPDDVTLLWSDDKQGYCRNLCNPEEQKRKGGSGIYYHLSYHGDPASWIWLSPLSPSFVSTELTKAYEYGARKIWVFNVGDIKPAEKEISFVMDLAWDVNRWKPENAHNYIKYWAAKTFGPDVASEIADIQSEYYRLQASGKDAHVYFVQYSEKQIRQRLADWNRLADKAVALSSRVPETLKDAYFELVSYPVRGAAMLNDYSLLARRSMVRASRNDSIGAMADADSVRLMFKELNDWTSHYNNEIKGGKWSNFFNWQPMQWFRSTKIDPPISTPEIIDSVRRMPQPQRISVAEAESNNGVVIVSDKAGEIPIWMEALSFVRNFSKAHNDNIFCHVTTANDDFDAAATPINNVWHSPWIGPMWSKVGVLHLKKGKNRLRITNLLPGAKIYQIYLGLWNPFPEEPSLRIPAAGYTTAHNGNGGTIETIKGLGFNDGVMVQPFDLPSDSDYASAPYVEYQLDIQDSDRTINILTLPTLHVYDGREERYAVQLGDATPQSFDIHAADFSAEWRRNVLRGYSRRHITIPAGCRGKQRLRIYFFDPGIVLQEIQIAR